MGLAKDAGKKMEKERLPGFYQIDLKAEDSLAAFARATRKEAVQVSRRVKYKIAV